MAGPWTTMRAWVRRHPYKTAAVLYVVLAALFVHDWDGYVFATAVRQFWHGHTPYEVAAKDPWYGYLNVADQHVQWYAYPPLPLLAMALTDAPAVFLHLPPFVGRLLLKIPVIAGTLALAWVGGRWARRLGASDEDLRRIERRFLFNPFLILVGPVWGMTDTGLMALCMMGVLDYAEGRSARAGVLLALATLVKPFPILLLLPVVPVWLRRDGWAPFRRFCAWAGATAGLLCLPFVLQDPSGFWHQAVGAHLARDPQGLTIWSLWPLKLLPPDAISVASLALMTGALLALGWAATRIEGRGTTLLLVLAAATAILVTNRVVNEQYLVLVVAPLLVLDVAHRLDRFAHATTVWTPRLFAAAIVFVGFHFLTFLPPDVAGPLLNGVSVDEAAHVLRTLAPWFWSALNQFFAYAVPFTILALGAVAARLVLRGLGTAPPTASAKRSLGPTAAACALLFLLALVPVLQPAVQASAPAFTPAYPQAEVAAFYYLWWQNPAHDPALRAGNWGPVSQVPDLGYYTTTRGVARLHAQEMVASGIDTAIVSYHRGELERYKVFQEEASAAGLRVVPLIELNQVYDQAVHHPINSTGVKVPYAAYRLDTPTREAIAQFVLDLKAQLDLPSTLRLDGKPVVMFYDSYVSGVSFWPQDRLSLSQVLLDMQGIDALRAAFHDPTMNDTAVDVAKHYPPTYDDFYREGSAALWRQAHVEQHLRFWRALRQEVEAQVGPVALVSGDATNERAGFEAGTIKLLAELEVFDGAFIYSPSFTWGNQPDAPFNDTFALWEDRDHWLTAFAQGHGALSSFGLAPSYDDTVNRPKHGFRIPADPPNTTQGFYAASWASNLAQPPTLSAVATFNEFFEGSSIEPTRGQDGRFLDATQADRAALDTRPPPAHNVTVLLHERSSRTSLYYAETDLSHFWGLDLLAAAERVVPDARFAAIDALEPQLPAQARPDLLLVEGGRGQFGASDTVLARLGDWQGAGVPYIVFGSDVSLLIDAPLGDNCLNGLDDVGATKTLLPGDHLAARDGGLWLLRDGRILHVGQTCDKGLHAGTSAKPWAASSQTDAWGGRNDALNAQCLAVAVKALQPAFAAPDAPTTCDVPAT